LIRAPLSTTAVLDESADIVAMTAAPWAAVLIVTAIPYRFLQAIFFDQLLEVGGRAPQYGNLLGATANMTVASILLAFWGRAVYARACRLAIGRGAAPGREAWRVSPAAFASYVLTGSAAVLAGFVSLLSIVGIFVAIMFAGLAIGTMELNERVAVAEPFRIVFRHAKRVAVPFALVLVFTIAAFVAFVNLAALYNITAWLASAVGGFDAPQWRALFGGQNRRFLLMLTFGALVLVEPFWIAAYVVYVRKAGAQESGDDLRTWFEELKRAS
jgi:hypothetical protein